MINKFCVFPLIFSALCGFASAELRLPAVIGSNMVLQRDKPIPIWGWAAAGDEVAVTLGSDGKKIKAGEDGRWTVQLDALPAGGPHELKVKSGDKEIVLSNVLMGEVWLCSGQSNMEWSVRASNNPQEEIGNAKYPKIRLFHIPKRPATSPQDDVSATWRECNPDTVVNFSAVGYYFGRHLHAELDVPIGLIGSAWGGTRIEPWTPLEGFGIPVDFRRGVMAGGGKRDPVEPAFMGQFGKGHRIAVAGHLAAGKGDFLRFGLE